MSILRLFLHTAIVWGQRAQAAEGLPQGRVWEIPLGVGAVFHLNLALVPEF